jgi:hypothetical protein
VIALVAALEVKASMKLNSNTGSSKEFVCTLIIQENGTLASLKIDEKYTCDLPIPKQQLKFLRELTTNKALASLNISAKPLGDWTNACDDDDSDDDGNYANMTGVIALAQALKVVFSGPSSTKFGVRHCRIENVFYFRRQKGCCPRLIF